MLSGTIENLFEKLKTNTMKTDAIFYQLFQTLPDLFFELAGIEYSESYQFQAVELKQTAFRLDGIFVPKEIDLPLIFVEVQFQKDACFYGRFFSEILLYLYQQQPKQTQWQAVAIFPSRTVDNGSLTHYTLLLPSLQRIYLDELPPQDNASLLNLLAIVIASDSKAIEIAKNLLQQPVYQNQKQALLLSTLETILVYKLPHLSREEIWKMINLSHIDITRTLFYQDAIQEGRQEGRQEGEKVLLLRVLTKRFGQLKTLVSRKIEQLSLHELEQLADDFLSFSNSEDLERWLADK